MSGRLAVPRPAGAGLARMLVERNALSFRRQWVAFVTGFTEPVFYLFSLGIGLGALVGSVTTDGGARLCRMPCSSPPRCSPRRR
jgi:lipooligosaccharide transport system permease protein